VRQPSVPAGGQITTDHLIAGFFTTRVPVSGGKMPAQVDEDGSAVIIHANPDDHMRSCPRAWCRMRRLAL